MATVLTTAAELQRVLSEQPQLTLLDVRLPEDFAGEHLPHAQQQCVFEVSFLDELEGKTLSKGDPICVYGAASDSHESSVAAEKLERAGYRKVYDFRGGLEAWKQAGFPLEGEPASLPPSLPDGRYNLDLEESKVEWTGR